MAARDPVLGLGAWHSRHPGVSIGQGGREGAEFLPRKLASEMVLRTFYPVLKGSLCGVSWDQMSGLQRPRLRGQTGTGVRVVSLPLIGHDFSSPSLLCVRPSYAQGSGT